MVLRVSNTLFKEWPDALFDPPMSVEEYVTERELDMQNAVASFIEMEQWPADKPRHWSSSSQTYVPADVLLESLVDGWDISPVVGREECWHGGGRHITVYYFELTRNQQAVVMPVLGNPIVRRLVDQRQLRVVLLTCDDSRRFEDVLSAA
jgi:hypothetical protein